MILTATGSVKKSKAMQRLVVVPPYGIGYGIYFWRCKKCNQLIFYWDWEQTKKRIRCPSCRWRVGPKSVQKNTEEILQFLTLIRRR